MSTAVVIDEWGLVRSGVEALLPDAGVRFGGAASTATDGFRILDATNADVLLIGVCADATVLSAVKRAAERPHLGIIALVTTSDTNSILELCSAGAHAVVPRATSERELIDALRHVANGDRYVAPQLLSGMFDRNRTTYTPVRPRFDLTHRERAVLAELAAGRTNQEIAERLCIGPETVKTHLGNIYAKLAVQRRHQAVGVALQYGLV